MLRNRSDTVGELADAIDKSQGWTPEVVSDLESDHLVERVDGVQLTDTYEATLLAELLERYALDKVLTGTKEDGLVALLRGTQTISELQTQVFAKSTVYNELRQFEDDGRITVDWSGRLNTYQRVGAINR